MIYINGSNLKKIFSGEVLFGNVSFSVAEHDKIGFVGVNGAGKTTLFKILLGEMDYDGGEIFKNKGVNIGYLEQYTLSDSDKSIWDEMSGAFTEVTDTERELEEIRLEIEMGVDDIDAKVARQVYLQERFAELDGFYYKSKIRSTLLGLGFSEEEFKLPVSKLSGGQRTRVSLGRLLLSDANLLLLDEPTNHLDINSVEWLEDFLRSYNGAFIVISHDRYFLDRVTNKTFELRNGRLKMYGGNYTDYMKQAETDHLTEERNYENTMREIERLEGIVEQQRRWNREKNIKTAESKMKVIEKLEKDLVKPDNEERMMNFCFKATAGGGRDVLKTEGLTKKFENETLFENADVFIKKGERVFLTGPNGCGKTTFLKIVIGEYEPTGGMCKVGENIVIGYYDQLQDTLDLKKTVLDELYDEYPDRTLTELRNALAVFKFRGEDVFKVSETLSGGERARVKLAKLMLKKNNFLIMDEPTNHLDIDSREALEKSLEDYDGTMLMVSHDRYFINKLADRILYMTPDKIISFSGNYDEFLEKRAEEKKPEEKKKESTGKLNYIEKKKYEAEKRKLLNSFKKVESEITKTEESIEEKTRELENPEISSDYVRLSEISAETDKLNKELEALYEEWDKLQAEIDERGYEI